MKRLNRVVVDKMCRFCVRKRRRRTVISSEPLLAKLFTQVTQLQFVTNGDYPAYICHECEKSLQRTADCILAFKEADAFWRIYFQRKTEDDADDGNSPGNYQLEDSHSNNFENDNMDTWSDSEANNKPSMMANEPCSNNPVEKENKFIECGAENKLPFKPADNHQYPIEEVILGDIQIKVETMEPLDGVLNNETNG